MTLMALMFAGSVDQSCLILTTNLILGVAGQVLTVNLQEQLKRRWIQMGSELKYLVLIVAGTWDIYFWVKI
jgi:hypothetical protein